MNEIRLPRSAAASSPRTLTGTIVFRRSGAAPRATMKSRTPPAHTASTASLSVVPNDRLIVFRSSSGRESSARRRRGEIGSLSSGAGGAGSSDSASALAARRASSAKPRSVFGRRTARAGAVSIPACPAIRSRRPSAMRGSAPGAGRGDHGSGSGAAASGLASSSRPASSTAAMPSTRQWWALPTTPIRPFASSSAIHSSHSGRCRLSGTENAMSASSLRSREVLWSTWSAMSKLSASTHSGALRPSGTPARRWR